MIHWHSLDAPEALGRLGSDELGLSSVEAGRRLAEFGPNSLPARFFITLAVEAEKAVFRRFARSSGAPWGSEG